MKKRDRDALETGIVDQKLDEMTLQAMMIAGHGE
jgi:hypothetical protein